MAEIKLMKKLIYAGDAYRAILEADPKLTYCIERIKAVDAVEVVHGRWIHRKETKWNLWDTSHYECSNCGSRNPLFNFNYCPNCGAKMDGERKDNDND